MPDKRQTFISRFFPKRRDPFSSPLRALFRSKMFARMYSLSLPERERTFSFLPFQVQREIGRELLRTNVCSKKGAKLEANDEKDFKTDTNALVRRFSTIS